MDGASNLERALIREMHDIRQKNGNTEDLAFIKYALSMRVEKAKETILEKIDKEGLK